MTNFTHRLKSPKPLSIVIMFNAIVGVLGFWAIAWSLAQDYTDLALYYALALTLISSLGNIVVYFILSRRSHPNEVSSINQPAPTPIPPITLTNP